MPFTILLITDPAERERLERSLHRIWGRGLRMVSDAADGASAEELLRRAQPDVLLVALGVVGIDVRAFVAAARQRHPQCAVCLLCDRAMRAQAAYMRPDRLLFRPLSVAEVQACLAELGKKALERDDRRSPSGMWELPKPSVASQPGAAGQSDLLRVDDLFADSVLPVSSEKRLPVQPAKPTPAPTTTTADDQAGGNSRPPIRIVRAV